MTADPAEAGVLGRYRSALSDLRAAQKPRWGTAAYSRLVNRPLGRYVAAAGHAVGATPNQATAVSASLSAVGIAVLATAPPTGWTALVVACALASGYVMDSVDGQLSRLRGGGSRSGEWLDHVVDAFKTVSLHAAVLIAWFRHPVADGQLVLLVPIAFQIAAVVTFFGMLLMEKLRIDQGISSSRADASESPARKWLLLPVDYGTVCWSFAVLAWPTAWLGVYALLCLAQVGALAVALRSWWRELRDADAAGPA